MIQHSTLPPDQFYRLRDAGGPLADVDPEKLKEMSIAVVEVDGLIVAYWVVFYALHVEPLWIAEAFRRSPSVVGGIVREMQTIVEATQEPAAFCVIDAGDAAPLVASYADRLGFHEAPGKLYYLVIQPAPALVEG